MNPELAELVDFIAELVAEEILQELEAAPPPEVPEVEVTEEARC